MAISHSVSKIRWVSRFDTCDRIVDFLKRDYAGSPRRSMRSERASRLYDRAAAMLASLATPVYGQVLADILLDPESPLDARLAAGQGLIRLGDRLPPPVIELLARNVGALLPRFFESYADEWLRVLGRFLLFLPFAEVEPAFRKYFSKVWPTRRGHFLVELAELGADWEWQDWLYQCWLESDRQAIDRLGASGHVELEHRTVSLNVRILGLTRHRPESQALLEEYRSRPLDEVQFIYRYGNNQQWFRGQWETLLPELWADEAELIQTIDAKPEVFLDRALRLELPWNALQRYYDADSLLTEIESEIRSASRIHARQRGREAYHDSPRLERALELLARAEDECVDVALNSLYHCPDLHHYLKGDLYQLMWLRAWHYSESQMRSRMRCWTKESFSDFYMGEALIRLSERPEVEDRDFYWWAVKHPGKPEFRYRGLVALEALGEDSPEWQLRLEELARDPDLITRVAAAGALLRKGDLSYLDQVVSATSKTNDPCVRAVALQCLGAYDAARFLPLFREIAREQVRYVQQDHPAAVEAAYQLACLATPAALSMLVEVGLRGSHDLFRSICDQLLPAAVSRSEGEAISISRPHPVGRYY